jgi:hypothetical protein
MILVCLFEFNSQNEGVTTMENFNYPCAFIVGNDIFDFQGNPLAISEQYYTAPNFVMDTIIGYGDENTICGVLYVENNICKVNKVG